VFFSTIDSTFFICKYLNLIERRRSDVGIMSPPDLTNSHRAKNMVYNYPELMVEIHRIQGEKAYQDKDPVGQSRHLLMSVIPWLLQSVPVYLDIGNFYKEGFLSPHGSVYRAYEDEIRVFERETIINHLRMLGSLEKSWRSENEILDKKAIEMYVTIHNNLGAFFSDRGMVEVAIEETEKALKVDPFCLLSLRNLGKYHRALGATEKTKELLKRIIDYYPHRPEGYYDMGNLSNEEGDIDTAIKMYNRVLRINTNYVSVYNNLALCYMKKNAPDDAVTILEQGLKVDPYNEFLQQNLKKIMEVNENQN
ncbi:MAG: tetratricopeptide repeat protein, partial [Thermodesulfobacteriota bacterium]|nr:tetratricopeptide repeat protein [Thermodesulfobacteriota bacterium]